MKTKEIKKNLITFGGVYDDGEAWRKDYDDGSPIVRIFKKENRNWLSSYLSKHETDRLTEYGEKYFEEFYKKK